MKCFCGCGARAVAEHHVIYRQELRWVARRRARDLPRVSLKALVEDPRNLVPVGLGCHRAHHDRRQPFSLRKLPDSVYEFAAEVLGPGPAYVYLSKRYAGHDERLDALVRCDRNDSGRDADALGARHGR